MLELVKYVAMALVEHPDQVAYGKAADEMCPLVRLSARNKGFHGAGTPANLFDGRLHDNARAFRFDDVARPLPHHARALPRILELVNQSLNDLLLIGLRPWTYGIPDQRE
jgi:hypothetical protein